MRQAFSLDVYFLLGQILGLRPKCEHPRPWEWGHNPPRVEKNRQKQQIPQRIWMSGIACSENLSLIVLKLKEEREATFACNVWVSRARGQSDPDEHLLKPPTPIWAELTWNGLHCVTLACADVLPICSLRRQKYPTVTLIQSPTQPFKTLQGSILSSHH